MNETPNDVEWFWNIVEKSIPAFESYDLEIHKRKIHDSLSVLSDADLLKFDYQFKKMTYLAYTATLWNVGCIIANGMGDDDFSDFRSALVAFGRSVFEKTLDNPDFLVTFPLTRVLVNNPHFYNPVQPILAEKHGEDYALENVYFERLPEIDLEKITDDPSVLKQLHPAIYSKFVTDL